MWNGGSQLVALNYQTSCHEMNINLGKFRDNGGVCCELNMYPQRNSQNYLVSSHPDCSSIGDIVGALGGAVARD